MRGNIGNFLIAISSAGFFSLSCVFVCVESSFSSFFGPGGGGKGPYPGWTWHWTEKKREKEGENLQIPAATKVGWTLDLTNFGRFFCFPPLSFFLWYWSVSAQSGLSCKAKLRITTKTKMAKSRRDGKDRIFFSLLPFLDFPDCHIHLTYACLQAFSYGGRKRESYFHISKKYAEKPDFGTYIYGEWGEAKEKEKLWHRIASNKSPYFPFSRSR